MSWFWRGAQSAVFYYLSCTPWFSYLHERKREKERNQARAAKAGEDVENGEYVHPLPSDTNAHWHEEIMMGPGLKRGRISKEKAKSESTKRLNTGDQDSSIGDRSLMTASSGDGLDEIDIVDISWNKKKYERPDEFLWGSDDPNCGSYASLSSRAANKPLVSGDGAYYNAPNPAVSELHPPVLCNRPRHVSQALWMTQPPPPAKVMEGKERADRIRSVSNASSGGARGTGGAVAGRQVSLRRPAVKIYDNIPDDMDPSPPDDDGKNVRGIEQQRNRSISDPVTDNKKNPSLIQISSDSVRGVSLFSSVSTANPLDGQDLQVSANSVPFISPLRAPQELVLPAVKIRASSPLRESRNTKLPFPGEVEEQFVAYTFPFKKSTKENDIPRHRWSMDI